MGVRDATGRAARPGTLLAEVRYPILPITLVHLAAFTLLAMVCHTRLAESRPAPTHLTGYFVCVSLGGVLGGAAAALVAPVVFSSILEYPLAIAAAILLRPQSVQADRMAESVAGRWVWRAGAALLFIAGYWCVSAFNKSANAGHLASTVLFTWPQSFTGNVEIAQRMVRVSFAIPAVPAVVHAQDGAALRRDGRWLARGRGRGENRRRGAPPRTHILRRARSVGPSERRLARADSRHDDAWRAGVSRQGSRPAHRRLSSLRADRRCHLHARS